MYSTIGPQTSLKKGHGLLISLRGLKNITTWSQVYGPIDEDKQRSTFDEWICTRRHISWPQITLFLNFSSRATFNFRNGIIWELFWWLRVHSFIEFSSLQILGSACSHRTCDHVVILFKRAEWNQWPMKRAKKKPQKTFEIDTNYDCWQGNKWGHQLGCEF